MKVHGIAEKLALKLYSGETGQKGDISAGNQSGTILTGVQNILELFLQESKNILELFLQESKNIAPGEVRPEKVLFKQCPLNFL